MLENDILDGLIMLLVIARAVLVTSMEYQCRVRLEGTTPNIWRIRGWLHFHRSDQAEKMEGSPQAHTGELTGSQDLFSISVEETMGGAHFLK
jgi:hypothetical protein